MMISTRGRYALRVLVDLAQNATSGFVPMWEVADRQGISLKYLERIMPLLTRSGLVTGAPGRGGGYKLAKKPQDCRVGDILRLTEGTLAPVACLCPEAEPCDRAPICSTLPMWKQFHELTNTFFDSITVATLAADAEVSRTMLADF